MEVANSIQWYPTTLRWWERLAMALGLRARFTPIYPVYSSQRSYTVPSSFVVTREDLESGDELYASTFPQR
jgi:hypothetical protein